MVSRATGPSFGSSRAPRCDCVEYVNGQDPAEDPAIVIDGRSVPLSAGMAVRAEIRTGTRRVIEYVLSPLVQHQKEALHER